MGAQGEGRRRAGRWQLLVAGGLVGLGVVGLASGAMAATPFPGPTGCAALSQRFGGGAAWTEIRFSSLPDTGGSRTASAHGVTVTITRTGPTSISWQASDGIDVVWVNAGKPPNATSAAYDYQPEATADSGLSGIGAQDPLDHVLVCFDPEQSTTTAPPVTEPATTAPPTTAPLTTQPLIGPPPSPPPTSATTEPPTVLSVPPQTPSTPRQAPPSEAPPRVVTPAPATAVMLPKTGSVTAPLVGLGASLVGLGLVTLGFARRSSLSDAEA